MNLQQLYYFRTVAELEHVTRAAEKLAITQPSISHSINDLEAELGVHLLERQGRNVKLTKYGAIFLEYVVEALDTLEFGKTKLNDFVNPNTGTISLAYFSSLEEFIPYMVSRFYRSAEQIQTVFQFQQLHNNQIEDSLLSGAIDVACATHIDNPNICAHKVGTHNLVLIVPASHPLAACESVDLRLLEKEKFITYDYQCRIRYHIDSVFQSVGLNPKILSETTHDTIIYSYVAANYGLGLVPKPLGGVRHYHIKELRIENELPPRDIYLYWKNVRHISPAVKNFRDFVIKSGAILEEFRNTIENGI